jgi:uncharacterized protein YndB with AHSA1/START domain
MSAYSFVTRWFIPAEVDRVWEALSAGESYGEWWPCIVGYRSLTPGVTGVGSRVERVVRGALPYRLRYVTTITRMRAPVEADYTSEGDLKGVGSFSLAPRDGGTEVIFHWDVETTSRVMNLLAPVLKPLFGWNHNWVMCRGEAGLARWLAATAAKEG